MYLGRNSALIRPSGFGGLPLIRRADNRASELDECDSFIEITVKDSTPQTVRGKTAKNGQAVCYRVRNTQGNKLLSVKVSLKTKDRVEDIFVETTDGFKTNDINDVTLEASPVAAFAIWSMEMDDDVLALVGGRRSMPFTITVTPVLRPTGAGQASAPPTTKAK